MSDYQCPVEGCDYGAQNDKTLGSVRSHVNAATDHPKWSTVSDRVEQLDESPREDEQTDDPEQAVEQAEGDEISPSEQPVEGDESAGSEDTPEENPSDQMPTDDEYQQQQEEEQSAEQTEAGETGESDESDATDQTAEQAAAATGAVGYLTGINPLVVVALAVGVLLVVSLATAEGDSTSGTASQEAQTVGDSEGDDERATSSETQAIEQTGGLS